MGTDEEVVYVSRRHPIVLRKPLAIWLGTLVAVTVAGTFAGARIDAELADRVIGAVAAAATLYAIAEVLRWRSIHYVITRERVMQVSGVLSVRVSSVPLSKVNDTTFTRSIWGRVVGFGDLVLESAGEKAGLSRLAFLPRPNEAYLLLTSLLAERDRSRQEVVRRPLWPGARVQGEDDTGPLPQFGSHS